MLFNQQEQGDLKLRVRALESERAFQRVATVQKTLGNVSFSVGLHACLVALFAFNHISTTLSVGIHRDLIHLPSLYV